MKKLLLVMLVSVLVLGVVSCGREFNGEPTPWYLQDAWGSEDASGALAEFVITGNQLTMLYDTTFAVSEYDITSKTASYRTDFKFVAGSNKDSFDSTTATVVNFTLDLYEFEGKKNKLVAKIGFQYDKDDDEITTDARTGGSFGGYKVEEDFIGAILPKADQEGFKRLKGALLN